MRSFTVVSRLIGSSLLLAMAAGTTAGCTTEAACFQDCTDSAPITNAGSAGKSSGGSGGSLMIGLGGDDGSGNGGKGGRVGLEDAGTECDGLDFQTDIDNCGECGRHCVLTGAETECRAGACVIVQCEPSRYDLNGDPEDGCELLCDGDPEAEETCNGEDDNCNGVKDESFDLSSDVEHCGSCSTACDLLNADSQCDEGVCKIDTCEDGFYTVDGLDSTGCEYPCHLKDKDGADCDPASAPAEAGCGVEVCDDIDQNCNGQINEGSQDVNAQCDDFCPTQGCEGLCTFGSTQCVGSVLVCVPGTSPTADVCDGLDNNCDGTPDEDFDFDNDTQHCGGCNQSCVGVLPHAFAKCENKQCKIDICESDHADLDPNVAGCEQCPVRPVRAESCNGKDDDCDGQTDEPAEVLSTKPQTGSAAGVNSYCKQRAGTLCNNVPLLCDSTAGGWVCQYPAGVESAGGKVLITEAKCDGIDGNCDGQKDEAFLGLGSVCDDGALGVCLDYGKVICDPANSSRTTCDPSILPDPPDASAEECNGLDDDCDGDVDNGTDDMVKITRSGLDFWIDKYEASRPDATDVTVGSDETHLCGIGDRLPWTGATFEEAETACAAGGKRLCDIEELEEACKGASNRVYPYGNSYVAGSCNGIDAAGSAPAPTGSFPSCVSTDGVFDLSGNVAEWSKTDKGNTTGTPVYDIMALQGGSFLTPQNGLTCTFDLDVISTNAVLASLGFRCCKDP